MRYFDFLVQEMKKAEVMCKHLLGLYENPPSTLTPNYSQHKSQQEFETARVMQLYHEFESFHPHELKLLLMDAQQALIFSEKENPENHWQEVIKAPFHTFFLDLSEPIALNQPEPLTPESEKVFGNEDFVHAICYRSLNRDEIWFEGPEDIDRYKIHGFMYELDPSTVEDDEYAFITFLCQTNGRGAREAQHTLDGKTSNYIHRNVEQVKIFSPALGGTMLGALANETGAGGKESSWHTARAYNLLNPDGIQLDATPIQRIDRSFLYHVKTGTVITPIEAVRDYFEDPSQLPENYPFKTITAGDSLGIENRYIGWYERSVLSYASLTSWILLYLMAKGIEIVEEPLPRSEKRRRQREKNKEESQYPKDWHVIQSKPRFSNDSSSGSSKGNGTGNPHRFRYDVMGHLRHGRHQLKDGTWKLTLEWVPAHQRGLEHTLYIPSVRKAETGKKSDERNYEYFRKPGELP